MKIPQEAHALFLSLDLNEAQAAKVAKAINIIETHNQPSNLEREPKSIKAASIRQARWREMRRQNIDRASTDKKILENFDTVWETPQ